MTLKEKLNWTGELEARLKQIEEAQAEITSGKAQRVTYYWFVGQSISCATELYLEGDPMKTKAACQMGLKTRPIQATHEFVPKPTPQGSLEKPLKARRDRFDAEAGEQHLFMPRRLAPYDLDATARA
ncbi:MAG TPA: hypothetical protein VJS65_05640, partial [Verrucomicrobiae bacterium]|nr:hypothetical protein [Verrucomicrobiae bacterium]